MLESTLVIWGGEFGRKPQIAEKGPTFVGAGGRDHWPDCYSIVMAGGGVKPGHLYANSDVFAAYPGSEPTRPQDIAATLYWSAGIDPHHTRINDQIRPPGPAQRRPRAQELVRVATLLRHVVLASRPGRGRFPFNSRSRRRHATRRPEPQTIRNHSRRATSNRWRAEARKSIRNVPRPPVRTAQWELTKTNRSSVVETRAGGDR